MAGLINGIGIGIFRVHPLIMTLGMSLVVLGFVTVYQRIMVAAGSRVPPEVASLGAGTSFGFVPQQPLPVPAAGGCCSSSPCRAPASGGCSTRSATTRSRRASPGCGCGRCTCCCTCVAAVLAGIAGIVLSGVTAAASATLADRYLLPSVAAAVIGGTSIFGGRGGYSGTIVGALILTVLTTLLTVLDMPEPVRQILFGAHHPGRRGRLHPRDRRNLTGPDR